MSEEFNTTLRVVEAAAFSPDLVPAMMERVARLCGGEMAIAFNTDPGKPDLLGGERAVDMQRDYLEGGWHEADVLTPVIRRLPRGGVRLSQDFVDLSIVGAPFCKEYLPRHGGPWGMGWHISTSSENDVVSISGFRPFQREQAELLQRLTPLIDTSLFTASSIGAAFAQGAAEALELSGHGAILLDARGCVSYVSATAEGFFGPEFGVTASRLRASNTASMRELARLTGYAQTRFATAPGYALVRRTGSWPIAIIAKRLTEAGLDVLRGGRVLLMLTELKPAAQPSFAILRRVYGLTPSEVRVASLFAGGASSEEISLAMSAQISTVRQHIKAVLTKTGTHRQAELALLLAAIPQGGSLGK